MLLGPHYNLLVVGDAGEVFSSLADAMGRRDQVHLPVVLKAAWGDVAKCGEMWRIGRVILKRTGLIL